MILSKSTPILGMSAVPRTVQNFRELVLARVGPPIPIMTTVKLKNCGGGLTISATIYPIVHPTTEAKTTFTGMNHLHREIR